MNPKQRFGEKIAWTSAILSGLAIFFIITGDSVTTSYMKWVLSIFLVSVIAVFYYENTKNEPPVS